MTETRFTWRWLLVIALVGIIMGLVFGLAMGWLVFPTIGSSNIAGLSGSAQNDYIVLVANTYSYDQDLPRAKQRLNQLQDKDVKTRVERLAKALAARKDPSAANVADLAVALGSESSELQELALVAANDGWGADAGTVDQAEPTKIARVSAQQEEPTQEAPAEATAKPTKARKKKPTATPTAQAVEPTSEPEPTQAAPKPTAVPKPTDVPPTAAPQPAPITTEFNPEFPAKWWDDIKFIPANVAPGQQYWKLKSARFCDWAPEERFDSCQGFPGGSSGVGIWIMTVDENGACVTTDVKDILNDGSRHPLTPDMIKTISFPWNPYNLSCDKDYEKEMYGEGNTISVDGLPSDTITSLQLCAKSPPAGYNPPPCGHAHVRYFLIFQRATR